MDNPIIVALDLPSAEAALELVRQLAPLAPTFKIGSELFTIAGPDIVGMIRATGSSVFLDLKYHDIPNTVAQAVAAATRLDVQMLTIHTAGGFEMMRSALSAAERTASEIHVPPPLVLGVTVLTSMDDFALEEVGTRAGTAEQVDRLAYLAQKSGLRGLVCSPRELSRLRAILPPGVQLVTPGIRTGKENADDQKRTLSARQAMKAGATWLVVGRPIYQAPDPLAALQAILADVNRID
jgi:orotidine-5'-phosphate decarboxylase